jgi:hypothetical protein
MAVGTQVDKRKPNVNDELDRVKRGLCGYTSYLSACGMYEAFSEALFYEPILRILSARKFSVRCEHECPGILQPKKGDRRRLDFYIEGHGFEIAMEVKYAKKKNINVDITNDINKLRAFLEHNKDNPNRDQVFALLCVFGKTHFIKNLVLGVYPLIEMRTGVYADLKRTKYGCRIFQMKVDWLV